MITVGFDYRNDAKGKDPDFSSVALRMDHQELWSKALPSGKPFFLEQAPGHYLYHKTNLGEFSLSSDAISNSMRSHKKLKHITNLVPARDLDSFQSLGSTIGARILFPGKKIDNKLTINVSRGLHSRIKDRFDLTLECIRLEYLGIANPLSSTLKAYWTFFELFENFDGYVGYFLLEDLLENGKVNFFLPFDNGFTRPPLPISIQEYVTYRHNTMTFVSARNSRIKVWLSNSPCQELLKVGNACSG